MSEIKYIFDNSEGLKKLEDAFLYFSNYFELNFLKEDKTVIVDSTRPWIKSLEARTKDETIGVSIYPVKESKIESVFKIKGEKQDYPIFYFYSSYDALSVGLQKENKKYIFEVMYQNPNLKKKQLQ